MANEKVPIWEPWKSRVKGISDPDITGLTVAEAKRRIKEAEAARKRYYTIRSIFGYNDVYFYLLLGGRGAGKSYTVLDRFLRDYKTKGIPFYWMRLTDRIAKELLQNNAAKFIDKDLVRKYDLELTVKGCEVFDHGNKMAEIMGISAFYNMKGTATYDSGWRKGYNICLDECQREVGEAVRFDISYSLVNSLENYVRKEKEKLRIVFICNYTETCADVLNLFNFIPEKWGRYHLAAKKAVLDFLPPTEQYEAMCKGSVANILMPNASTFTNQKVFDKGLLNQSRKTRPIIILDFNNPDEKYTIWETQSGLNTISMWDGNLRLPNSTYAMVPFCDGLTYNPDNLKLFQKKWDNRALKFDCLVAQQRFALSLARAKKR